MHVNPKGIMVPDAGDDLLTGVDRMISSAGTIQPYDSLAAFQTAVDSAKRAGLGPTATSPWYADIHGVMYISRGDGGLSAVNAPEHAQSPLKEWTENLEWTLARDQPRIVQALNLPTRPYPRLCYAFCSLWGRVTKGEVDVILYLSHRGAVRARFPTVSDGNVTCSGAVIVDAGQEARFEASVIGAGGDAGSGGTVQVDRSQSSVMTVVAWPASMA